MIFLWYPGTPYDLGELHIFKQHPWLPAPPGANHGACRKERRQEQQDHRHRGVQVELLTVRTATETETMRSDHRGDSGWKKEKVNKSPWTWPIEFVDWPNLKIVIFHSCVGLPEGILVKPEQNNPWIMKEWDKQSTFVGQFIVALATIVDIVDFWVMIYDCKDPWAMWSVLYNCCLKKMFDGFWKCLDSLGAV